MEMILTLVSGIGWMVVYEECIRLGLRQKTYAMPFWALGLNFAWEVIYSFSDLVLQAHGSLQGMTLVQAVANAFWALLDVVILYTYVKNGKSEWPKKISNKMFYPYTVLVLVCCFALQLVFIAEYGFELGAQYSAFLQNLLMSVLFIHLFIRRGSMKGQSLLMAVAKWLGTLAPTLLMGFLRGNKLVMVAGIFCSVFDLIYIYLLLQNKKSDFQN